MRSVSAVGLKSGSRRGFISFQRFGRETTVCPRPDEKKTSAQTRAAGPDWTTCSVAGFPDSTGLSGIRKNGRETAYFSLTASMLVPEPGERQEDCGQENRIPQEGEKSLAKFPVPNVPVFRELPTFGDPDRRTGRAAGGLSVFG